MRIRSKTCHRRQARENESHDRFSFASDLLKEYNVFSDWLMHVAQLQHSRNTNPRQTESNSQTVIRFSLIHFS